MGLLCTTLSLVLGLYFFRNNIFISIIISLIYLIFIYFRFSKKVFVASLLFLILGISIPAINFENNSNSYPGFVVESKTNYILFQSKWEKYYIPQNNNDFEVGDYLVISGEPTKLNFLSFESQFNFENYLNNKGVKREIKVNIIDVKYRSFLKINKFKNRFLSHFDKNTAGLISSFLFNEKDYSSLPIKSAQSINLVHLFSLSGVYLHLLFSLLNHIISLKFSEKASEILPFIILLPYAIFSFSKIGTLRVYLLYLLKYINKHYLKKRFTYLELVSLLALFFLIINHNLVYQESFYIGFLLSVLIPFFRNSISFVKKKKRKYFLTLLIYTFLIPISVTNGSLHIFSILFSLILVMPNFIFILLSQISLIIPFYGIVNKSGSILTWILKKLDLIDISIPFSALGGAFSFLFFVLFLTGMYFLESIRIKKFKITSYLIISLTFLSIVPIQEPITNAIYFVNVGQGDSIIIKNRIYTVMIDTGGYAKCDMAVDTLIPFMNKKKITHIDALITTHDDFDHCGAKDSLIQNFSVKKYLNEKNDFPYKIGDLYIENLNSLNNTTDNDSSLVLKLNFMKKKWLFMGDASTKVEDYLINNNFDLDCDILKIGHHGSKSSTSKNFLKATTPDEAIISVGAKNLYKHPNDEVLKRLNDFNIKIRRTDLEGTISYLSFL